MVKKVSKTNKQKTVKQNNDPKETGSRENAIIQELEENPQGLTVEEIGAEARRILNIKRKVWNHAIWQLKKDGKISYNKEAKKYTKV